MAKDPTYHTTSREYPEAMREVHHDHNNCPDGKRIKPEHRSPGTNGKRLCKECAKLS